MKKVIVAILTLLIISPFCFSQKFDNEVFSYQNTHLPSKLIYDQIKNYGVNVLVNNSSMYTMDYNFANSLPVTLTSYDKIDYANAQLKVAAVYGPCSFIEEKTSSSVREEEVNKVKVKVTYYKRTLSFRFPISYKLLNSKNNTTLYNNEFSLNNIRSIESPEYKSEGEAVNFLTTNRDAYVANHINELCKSFMGGCNSYIRDMFDFYPAQTSMDIFKFKKWDKDDEYNAHVKTVMEIFKGQTADEQPEMVKEKLKNEIAYFQTFEGVFSPTDKKEDILYFCNYFNLATIFFCLDDYAKADYYTQKLDSSDKQERLTKMLKGYIVSAKKRTAKHFVANTHLTYNPVKDFRLEGKDFASDAASASENVAASLVSGKLEANDKVVFSDNKEMTGKIVFVREKNELQMIPKENPDKPILLTPINCLRFNIDSINYVVVKNKNNGPAVKQIFKVQYSSDKIKLIQYMDNFFAPSEDYIGFIKPTEEFVTMATGLGVKKRLASYFEDCEAVSNKAKDGDYGGAVSKNMMENFKKACEDYSACK